jgi:hypothetical protein
LLDYFKEIHQKFDQAGIQLSVYNYSFRDDFTGEEIERGFEMTKALGVNALTASSTVSVTRRVAWGEGDTPLSATLELLKARRWGIAANIEYAYKDSDTVAEVKRCYAYCKRVLET